MEVNVLIVLVSELEVVPDCPYGFVRLIWSGELMFRLTRFFVHRFFDAWNIHGMIGSPLLTTEVHVPESGIAEGDFSWLFEHSVKKRVESLISMAGYCLLWLNCSLLFFLLLQEDNYGCTWKCWYSLKKEVVLPVYRRSWNWLTRLEQNNHHAMSQRWYFCHVLPSLLASREGDLFCVLEL